MRSSDDQHADAMVMAEVIANWVLDMQANAPAGSVAEELERDADFHFVVHNAAGMVSVQLGVSITEALIRLRAFAFSNDRLVARRRRRRRGPQAPVLMTLATAGLCRGGPASRKRG